MRVLLFAALFAAWCPACPAQNIAVANARVYPSPDAKPLEDATVLIHDGKISAIGSHIKLPIGTTVPQCNGCSVFAGFWNAPRALH